MARTPNPPPSVPGLTCSSERAARRMTIRRRDRLRRFAGWRCDTPRAARIQHGDSIHGLGLSSSPRLARCTVGNPSLAGDHDRAKPAHWTLSNAHREPSRLSFRIAGSEQPRRRSGSRRPTETESVSSASSFARVLGTPGMPHGLRDRRTRLSSSAAAHEARVDATPLESPASSHRDRGRRPSGNVHLAPEHAT